MMATKEPSLEESLAEWQRRIASYAASLQALRVAKRRTPLEGLKP